VRGTTAGAGASNAAAPTSMSQPLTSKNLTLTLKILRRTLRITAEEREQRQTAHRAREQRGSLDRCARHVNLQFLWQFLN